MIDVDYLKARIDCRELIARDLGKPKARHAHYSSYKCPLHNEVKGFSLVVYADHWHCFGKCGRGGDAIGWLQSYHNLSFQVACDWLSSGDLPQLAQPRSMSAPKLPVLSEPPDTIWQKAARKVAQQAMDTLWGKEGKRAWRYLEEERGLIEDVIVAAGLGYIPGHYQEWKMIEGLNIPCGITIPWFADDSIWGIKVRRAAGQQRYQQLSGGNIKGGLYLADDLQPGLPLLLTEGEFDALISQQIGTGLISAAAIGSAANRDINPRWFPKLIAAPKILVRMDADQAGAGAAAQIASLSQAVRCVQVPQGKDVNEFYLSAGQAAVQAWMRGTVEQKDCIRSVGDE